MKRGELKEYFSGIAAKRLHAVEVSMEVSHQHEFNGVTLLKNMLGEERVTLPARYIYLSNDEDESPFADGSITWYDARENHPTRSEYRLYFRSNEVMARAEAGDLLVFCKRSDEGILLIVAPEGSTAEQQLIWMFGLDGDLLGSFRYLDLSGDGEENLGLAARYILEAVGIDAFGEDERYLEDILSRFNGEFPATREFSRYARETTEGISSIENPDLAILEWLEREELLFRTLERHLVRQRLQEGFVDDVDAFVGYSLSIQNRRKSRAGLALENHLEQIFVDHQIRYSRNKVTENRSRPDFIFPGIKEYHHPEYPKTLLTMLGVKSTLKDRWRQVLAEANKISDKHLLTLEPGISTTQTGEMQSQSLRLVIPESLHDSFQPEQRDWLISLEEFIDVVGKNQGAWQGRQTRLSL